jgi:hypothetical protein
MGTVGGRDSLPAVKLPGIRVRCISRPLVEEKSFGPGGLLGVSSTR